LEVGKWHGPSCSLRKRTINKDEEKILVGHPGINQLSRARDETDADGSSGKRSWEWPLARKISYMASFFSFRDGDEELVYFPRLLALYIVYKREIKSSELIG
jgi:hypothetical protein